MRALFFLMSCSGTRGEVNVAGESNFAVGNHVLVKPAPASCTKRWALGQITGIASKHRVCVNGVPQHMRNVRKRRYEKARERSWYEPKILHHSPVGQGDLGSGTSLAQLPDDVAIGSIGCNADEALQPDERPDVGGTEQPAAVGTQPVGVGEQRAVDYLEVTADQLPVQLERLQ